MSSSGKGRLLRTQMIRRLGYGGTPTALAKGLNNASAPLIDYFWGSPEYVAPECPQPSRAPVRAAQESFFAPPAQQDAFWFFPECPQPSRAPVRAEQESFFAPPEYERPSGAILRAFDELPPRGLARPVSATGETFPLRDRTVAFFDPTWPQPPPRPPTQQPPALVEPRRERTSTFFGAFYPDRIVRPAPQQPDALTEPRRERTAIFLSQVAPDRIVRPAPQQPPALVEPRRERSAIFLSPVAPDRIVRPAPQQPDAFTEPRRERTSTFFGAFYPDRIVRPAPQQPPALVEPRRERTSTFFGAFYPDRVIRPTPQQPPALVEPRRERTSTPFDAVYPDRIVRPVPQQPPALVEPRRERSAIFLSPVAPDRIVRPAPQQPDSFVEPRVVAVPIFFGPVYPDRIVRPTPQQPDAFTEPRRERNSTFFGGPFHPGRIVRPTPQQPDAFVEPRIERTSTPFDAVYPDRIVRPTPQQPDAQVQPPWSPSVAAPTFSLAVYPDRIVRPVPQQPDAFVGSLEPIPNALVWFDAYFPSRFDLPRFQQLDVLFVPRVVPAPPIPSGGGGGGGGGGYGRLPWRRVKKPCKDERDPDSVSHYFDKIDWDLDDDLADCDETSMVVAPKTAEQRRKELLKKAETATKNAARILHPDLNSGLSESQRQTLADSFAEITGAVASMRELNARPTLLLSAPEDDEWKRFVDREMSAVRQRFVEQQIETLEQETKPPEKESPATKSIRLKNQRKKIESIFDERFAKAFAEVEAKRRPEQHIHNTSVTVVQSGPGIVQLLAGVLLGAAIAVGAYFLVKKMSKKKGPRKKSVTLSKKKIAKKNQSR